MTEANGNGGGVASYVANQVEEQQGCTVLVLPVGMTPFRKPILTTEQWAFVQAALRLGGAPMHENVVIIGEHGALYGRRVKRAIVVWAPDAPRFAPDHGRWWTWYKLEIASRMTCDGVSVWMGREAVEREIQRHVATTDAARPQEPEPDAVSKEATALLATWPGRVTLIPDQENLAHDPAAVPARYGEAFALGGDHVRIRWQSGRVHSFCRTSGRCLESEDGTMGGWMIAPHEMHRYNPKEAEREAATPTVGAAPAADAAPGQDARAAVTTRAIVEEMRKALAPLGPIMLDIDRWRAVVD